MQTSLHMRSGLALIEESSVFSHSSRLEYPVWTTVLPLIPRQVLFLYPYLCYLTNPWWAGLGWSRIHFVHHLHYKAKPQPHSAYCEQNELCLSQTQHVWTWTDCLQGMTLEHKFCFLTEFQGVEMLSYGQMKVASAYSLRWAIRIWFASLVFIHLRFKIPELRKSDSGYLWFAQHGSLSLKDQI